MRFCTNCGEPAGGGSFCGSCGSRLDVSAPPAGQAADPAAPDGPSAEMAGSAPDEKDAATSPVDQPAARRSAVSVTSEPAPPGADTAGDATAGRTRRGVVGAVGAVVGAGVIAAAALLVFDGSEASEGYPLAAPDLAEQPQLAWMLDRPAIFAVEADNGLLVVSSGVYEDDPVVYGVEPDTGRVRWTQNNLGLSFEPGSIWCYVPLGEMVVCSVYGQEQLAVLALDPADGARLWAAEYPSFSSNYMHAAGDGLVVANYDRDSGDVEVSRMTIDGTAEWTSTDNVSTDGSSYIAALGTNEQHVLVEVADEHLLGFNRATGQPVPWLKSESADDLSLKLVKDGAIRVDRQGDGALVERLDDQGAAVWTRQQAEQAEACNEVDYEYLYLCSDGSVSALNWTTGETAWSVGVPEGFTYAGETEDSVVFAELSQSSIERSEEFARQAELFVVDAASGRQRWRQQTQGLVGDGGWYTGSSELFPVGENYVYAVEDVVGSNRTPTPAPAGSSAVVARDLDTGEEAWRVSVPQMSDSETLRVLAVNGRLLVINGGKWIAALE